MPFLNPRKCSQCGNPFTCNERIRDCSSDGTSCVCRECLPPDDDYWRICFASEDELFVIFMISDITVKDGKIVEDT